MTRARSLSQLANSSVFTVATNNRVGIGSEVPTAKLDVDGTLNVSGNATIGGVTTYEDVTNVDSVGIITARSTIDAKGDISIADKIIHTGDTNTAIRFPAADTVTIETGGTEGLRVTSAGNLTIGNSSVAFPSGSGLQVYHASAPRIKLTNSTTGVGSGDGSYLYVSGSDFIIENKEGADMRFYTSAQEAMRIDSSGNMGLGTITLGSNAKFEVKSTTGAIDSATIRINGGETATGTINTGSTLLFAGHDGSNERDFGSVFAGKENGTSGNRAAYLAFGTRPNGGSVTERMRIDSSGRLMLGTTTAGFNTVDNLTIADSGNCGITIRSGTSSSSSIYFADGTSGSAEYEGYIDYQHSTNVLRFGGGGGQERMRIDSSGRLLVGQSSSPSIGSGQYAKIFVAGYVGGSPGGAIVAIARDEAASAMSSGDTLGSLVFSDNAGGTFASVKGSADAAPSGTSDFPGRLTFLTTSDGASTQTERMRIDSSGRLLVGTSSQTQVAKFVVQGQTNSATARRSAYIASNKDFCILS